MSGEDRKRKKRKEAVTVSSSSSPVEVLKIELIPNALDFLREGVERAGTEDDHDLKYAALALGDAVELLLKARLKREHWSLLFADVNRADAKSLARGEFKSVDFKDLVERLERIVGLDLRNHKAALDQLRDRRNRIRHFGISESRELIVSLAARVCHWSFDFILDELSEDLDATTRSALEEIKEHLPKFEEFVKHRLKEIERDLAKFRAKHGVVIECPSCEHETLPVDGEARCRFCRSVVDPREAAAEWMCRFGGGSGDPKESWTWQRRCPECASSPIIDRGAGDSQPPSPRWICLSCASTWEWDALTECDRCDALTDSETDTCADCMRYIMEKD